MEFIAVIQSVIHINSRRIPTLFHAFYNAFHIITSKPIFLTTALEAVFS